MNTDQIIDFWKAYNQYLIEIVRQIPAKLPVLFGTSQDGQKYALKLYSDDADSAEQYLTPIIAR
ncbi:hypothetical protein [Dyadobacter luticola]|uniref:Uncharacterized protein n=1 Tax=Dyadobacter luticola TaxID=1979387 RepID=A0A5R9L3V4_9BACT|nr:hypothetical protein [Dyadobacter luticola]TLV03088.1 hypothetical protein FEN17_05605 [Dyadobacter luticola]